MSSVVDAPVRRSSPVQVKADDLAAPELAVRIEDLEVDARSMVARISAILTVFGAGDRPLSISEISRRAELPKSTVSRIVRDLVACGMLERIGRDIRPGMRLFEFGESVGRPHDLRRLALGSMLYLRDSLGLAVHLAVLDHDEVLYLKAVPAHPNGYSPFPGRVARMPAHATAAGKALLAFSAPEVVARVVSKPLARVGPRTITQPRILLHDLETVSRSGYSMEREESRPGVACVAVPVADVTGCPVVALSVTGPEADIVLDSVLPALQAAAAAVRRRLLRASW